MKVQIYSHRSPEEVAMSAAAGVDFLGFVPGAHGRLKFEMPYEDVRALMAQVPPHHMAVALTVAYDVAEIVETVQAVRPHVLHLSGEISEMPIERVAELRQAIPFVKILTAIAVGGPETREEALKYAVDYQHVSDYYILDTDNKALNAIGATGITHDWSISAEIVRTVNIPIIMAGGLSPANVADAVRVVRPWAVDSYTHTNNPATHRKDPALVKAFVDAAKSAL